ncbi:unnamed protein product [Caenorhabditis bovis]|uniref:Uncharacterized protein n=1 Tax=Caenorhabditis bovis TaxID=2654633 RepID=A0A8S1F0I6_9PELO|nr:unnamed protein product [Caenorhabditis bovis]
MKLISLLLASFIICHAFGMQELRTRIDPIRTFDIPEEAPRARILAVRFSKKPAKIRKPYKNDPKMDDFTRFGLGDLTDRDMRSSKEVKRTAHRYQHRFLKTSSSSSPEDFFP